MDARRLTITGGLLALLFAAANPSLFASAQLLTGALGEDILSPDEAELAASINIFGDEMFNQLANETSPVDGPGLVISPFSISQALALLMNGVEPNGTSYQQLQSMLGGEQAPLEDLNAQLQTLTARLLASSASPDSGVVVSNANSAWLKEGLRWQPQYAEALQEYFNATLGTLTSAQEVNSWVAEATRNKITDIVDDGIVADAVLILVNAVYFKGSWMKPFEESETTATPFQLAGGGTMQAAMMYQQLDQGSVQVAELPAVAAGVPIQCQAVQLMFSDFEYAGIAAQPVGNVSEGAGDGQLVLETAAGPVPYTDALAACRSGVIDSLPGTGISEAWTFSQQPVDLYMPRFEIEFFASLNQALQALGLTQPFVGGDLTRMAEDAEGNPVQGLMVSEVLHKVYEKVDEKGAEAAAVTAIAVTTSAPAEPKQPVELRFDRPFMFSIVHWPSGLALFNGEIYEPEEWEPE